VYDSALQSKPPPRILILEPNPGAAEIIDEVLSTVGCLVAGPCSTLQAAKSLLNGGTEIDGAVLEMRVAGSFSFELAAQLLNGNKAIIFFSRCDRRILPRNLRTATVLRKPKGIELLAGIAAATFFRLP
jgi:hypothetical protein